MESTQKSQNESFSPYNYDTGIEQDYEEELITDPFDPEQISIDSKVIPMETFLRRIQQKTIKLNPDFQRHEVWDATRKSQLIESLMLKIPLPMFYVSADEKSNFTVVDGLQRLSTIRSFVLGDSFLETGDESIRGHGFKLQNLEFWKPYEGLNYAELPVNVRNRILESEFNFTIINPGTPEEVRRNIFKRLNTGGLPLSAQEIRNALYLGPSTELLNKLASMQEFKMATNSSIKTLRMEDRELILRFLSFLIRDYSTYRKAVTVDTYLSDTMVILNSMPSLSSREFKKIQVSSNIQIYDINVLNSNDIISYFKRAMIRGHNLFGSHAFRKSFGTGQRTPINKSLFETLGVILARLTEHEFEQIVKSKNKFLGDCKAVTQTQSFLNMISRDSMQTFSVQSRFETFLNIINYYTS